VAALFVAVLFVAAVEAWEVEVAVLVDVGNGVLVRVALGDGIGVEVLVTVEVGVVVTVEDGVVVTVWEGVSVSVSLNGTWPIVVVPFIYPELANAGVLWK
jgi:hypothetical protein